MVDKGKIELNTDITFGGDIAAIPVSFNYGLGKNFGIFAGIDLFNQSYNYLSKKIGGVGDANIGLKFRFQHSEKFNHVFQALVKIPTASKETDLGTGKADFHFGLAESYLYKTFGYDISFEFSMLGRRDFPAAGRYPPAIQLAVERQENLFNYSYEPALVFSLGPSIDVSKNVILYIGYSFTRNMRLNYNTSLIYGGAGITFSKRVAFSIGGSYGLQQAGSWNISAGFNFVLN